MMMRRALTPRIEAMENKCLLSGVAPILGGAPSIGVSPPPAETGPANLAVSMTTSATTVTPGEVVKLTFTETNNTSHDVFVDYGPSTDGFIIKEGGTTIWQSNAGLNPLYIRLQLLAPGESITLTADWTATSASGTFVAFNQLDTAATATFSVAPSTPVVSAWHSPYARPPTFPTQTEVLLGSLSSLETPTEQSGQ
jgi:hypothetical protein